MICATDDPHHLTCARSGHCTVNFMWVRVRDAIAGALDSMTLADLVPGAARLDSLAALTAQVGLASGKTTPLTLD